MPLSAQSTAVTLFKKEKSLRTVPGHFVLTSPPGIEIMGNNPFAAASDITDLYLKSLVPPPPPTTRPVHPSSPTAQHGMKQMSRGLTRR